MGTALTLNDILSLARAGLLADPKGQHSDRLLAMLTERSFALGDRRDDLTARELRECATAIVLAFLSKNEISRQELGLLVTDTFAVLSKSAADLDQAAASGPGPGGAAIRADGRQNGEPLTPPATGIRVPPDSDPRFVTCLECGNKFRSLRRHLRSAHGLSPEAYRFRWGLSGDSSIVAKELSQARSEAALAAGFGFVRAANRAAPPMAKGKLHGQTPK